MRGNRRWDETWHRLRDWTNGSGPAERLAQQVLLDEGFTDLDPSHPLGGKDGGADALVVRDGNVWVSAFYFPRGQQTLPDIEKKFFDDFEGVARNGADGFVFVTNQELRRAERLSLQNAVGAPSLIFHLERLVSVLDRPRMHGVREQYLNIEAPSGFDRDERLAELGRSSVARCEARWLSVGIPPNEASELAAADDVGRVDEGLLPSAQQRLVIWTAPMGSGKSIASERHHQQALAATAVDESAPLPVFLSASEAVPQLSRAVTEAATELGEPRRCGAAIVVDGLDELGYQAATNLLLQARELVRTWPQTTVLMTSRPVPALTEADEHIALPALTDAEQEACVDIGAGCTGDAWRPSLHSLEEPVRATLGQPLFALLAGLWMRERGTAPRAPIELMRLLGERAARGLQIDEQMLRELAIRSITRELRPVPAGDVLGGRTAEPLLASGMVAHRDGGLQFVLPAVAQWFAAQAILLNELTVEDVVEVPEDVELWRYPLALVLALGSAEQVRRALLPLLEGNAGFAMRVLEAAFGQSVMTGATPPPWREGGAQVREALQALANALGPVAPLVVNTDADGRLLPMAVASSAIHLTVAFSNRTSARPDVFALPRDVSPFDVDPDAEWVAMHMAQVGPGAAWAWSWSLGRLRHGVNRLLGRSELPISLDGPLAREAAWVAACDLVDESFLTCDKIEIARVLEAIDNLDADFDDADAVILERDGRQHDLVALRYFLRGTDGRGERELQAPIPPADNVLGGGGWICDLYSEERLLAATTKLYESAIIGYRQLVERWFPTLLGALEHRVLMPMRVVGSVSLGRSQAGDWGGAIPTMAGHIEALPAGALDEVVLAIGSTGLDHETVARVLAQQREARPEAARWVSGNCWSGVLDVGDRYAISDLVYKWLARDLKRLGLWTGTTYQRKRDTLTRWDLA